MAAGKRILFMDAVGPLARNLVGRFSESGGNSLFLVGRNEQHICSSLSHVKSEVAAPNSFESVYAKAKEHLGGKPNVVIANAGCGRFSLLQPSSSPFLSPPETKKILGEDLTTFRQNLEFAHESLSSVLSDVYEPIEEDQKEVDNPCHVVVLGSMAGYNRLSTGGATYDSELTYFYENMRKSIKDSNVNMVLMDLAADHISTAGRVVMYNTKYEPPYSDGNTEEEVEDAITKFLDISNSDLSKIIWPNYAISGSPMLQKLKFNELFKENVIPKSDEFVVETFEPVVMAAPTEETAEEEEVKVEKTIFNIVLSSVDDLAKNKLKVIKAIRAMKPEDSLVQCKEYVTKMPAVLLKDVPKEDADKFAQTLKDAGGVVELQ